MCCKAVNNYHIWSFSSQCVQANIFNKPEEAQIIHTQVLTTCLCASSHIHLSTHTDKTTKTLSDSPHLLSNKYKNIYSIFISKSHALCIGVISLLSLEIKLPFSPTVTSNLFKPIVLMKSPCITVCPIQTSCSDRKYIKLRKHDALRMLCQSDCTVILVC